MPRKLVAAAVQMDAAPALTDERLERADALVAEAASSGAQLVVLPELFNTGYTYSDANYARAETIKGATATWMKRAAAQYKVHIAGTLLLIDGNHVYNSALLVSPKGRVWRYDKNFPWGWERAYYREGRGITIADTDLGRLGMMICWDYAHPELWQRYAGNVDAMVMMSCPPDVTTMSIVLPDGTPLMSANRSQYYSGDDEPFGEDLNQQVGWLGVPLVNSTGAGRLLTHMPSPYLSMLGGLSDRPELLSRLDEAPTLKIDTGYIAQAKVVDADGQVVSRVTAEGDGFVLGQVTLSKNTPQPNTEQPKIPMTSISYLYSDVILPMITTPLYRQGYRQQFGSKFAPFDQGTKLWGLAVLAALGVGYVAGRINRH
jgi:predicted amidohydrolase